MNPLIEKYFENSLNQEEKEVFGTQMKESSEFRSEFEFENNLKAALHNQERKEMKAFLQSLDNTPGRSYWGWISGIAATILLVSSLLFFLTPKQNGKLAEAYFHPLPNMISPAVRSTNTTSALNKAFELYDNESYDKAAEEFLKLENAPYASVYAGISYMAAGRYDKSLAVLNAGELEDTTFEAYRKWYLGLTYLRKGEQQQAKQIFKQLGENSSPVTEMAKKILSELE